MSKIVAILTVPNTEPVCVEITDADKETRKAFVETPAGIELYVDYSQLHGVEYINSNGKRTFLGDPPADHEPHPTLIEALTAPVVGTIKPDGVIEFEKTTAPTSSRGSEQEAMKKPATEILSQH